MIVTMRREKPTWGAGKLRERLLRKLPNDVRVPACSTIHAIMDRHGLVTRQRHSRTKNEGTSLSEGSAPNDLCCTDHKGEFMLRDKRYCYHRRTPLPLPRSDGPGYLLWENLHFQKKINLSTSLAGQAVGIKEVERWHLASDVYELRSRVYRSGGKNPPAPK